MNIILSIVAIISVVLVIMVLLQQGKGAEEATTFGAGGKNSGVLTGFSTGAKIILVIAVLFFVAVFTVHIGNKDNRDELIERLGQKSEKNQAGALSEGATRQATEEIISIPE